MLRLLWPIWRRFEAAARDPAAAQSALWAGIARGAESSPMWGERWGPSGAPPLRELPLTEFGDYIEACNTAFERGGMPTADGQAAYWAESGGTTAAKPKLLPYLAGSREQRLAAFGPIGAYLYRLSIAEPRIPFLPLLLLANAGTHEPSPTGVPVGYATAYVIAKMPPSVRGALAIPWQVYGRPDLWEEWGPLYAVATDLSLTVAISAGYLARFYRALLRRMDAYWPYLAGEPPPPPLPPVKVHPRRLRFLKELFSSGTPTIREVWPRMAALLSWTSASAALQLPLVEPYLGGLPVREYPYFCTESPITFPLYDGAKGNPVHPGAAIVELLPEDAEPVAENVLPSWQAEPGGRYEVVVTTINGLIRYRLYDIVECHGFFHRAPRLTFRSKCAFLLQVTSTAIPEDDVAKLLRGIGYRAADDLMVGPHPTRSAYAMYVREGSDAGGLAGRFEDALTRYSKAYAIEREKGVLAPVEAITVRASHPMWEFRTREQAKSRYVLPTAPRDLGSATAGAGRDDGRDRS